MLVCDKIQMNKSDLILSTTLLLLEKATKKMSKLLGPCAIKHW